MIITEHCRPGIERELMEQAAENKIRQDEAHTRIIINEMLERKKKLERIVIDIEKVLLTSEESPVEKIKEIEEIINKIK